MRKIYGPVLLFIMSCGQAEVQSAAHETPGKMMVALDRPKTISGISVPAGFTRLDCNTISFGHWLRQLDLKTDKRVYLYNGRLKPNQDAQFAVLHISVGNKDLQQCADAVMRLRAEYLFQKGDFSGIVFSDNLAKKYAWKGGNNRAAFSKYLDLVFGMCGTASLEKQLKYKSIKTIEPGDVFIKGGFPGHAMIVADVAINKKGDRIFMLAQSYMPAQDIHIVKNPGDPSNPWYRADDAEDIITPEWTFKPDQLKKW